MMAMTSLIGCVVAVEISSRARFLAVRIALDVCAGVGLLPSLGLVSALADFFAHSFSVEDLEGLV